MAQKAEIHVLDKDGSPTKVIKVMFNPTEYTYSESTEYLDPKSSDAPEAADGEPVFGTRKRDDFTVNLFFATYEKGRDVRDETQAISDLTKPTVDGKKKRRPPICLFTWGNFSYKGVVKKVDQKFTLFMADGAPVRAELTVLFQSVLSEKERKDFLGLSQSRKFWVVRAGERLDLIAFRAFKDASLWRVIALANGIDDPLSFPRIDDVGRVLIIPDIHN